MSKKRHSVETIIRKLREAEVLQAKGETVPEISRQLGVTGQIYYRVHQQIEHRSPWILCGSGFGENLRYRKFESLG